MFTTSSRAVPRPPSIEDERNRAARLHILEYLGAETWDLPREQRGRLLALRSLVQRAHMMTPDTTFTLLSHVADCLGIDLSAGTTAGEAPR